MSRLAALAAGLVMFVVAESAFAIDLGALWDFGDPAASEQRFRDALATSRGDDALVLRTQIARTYGLRRDFERARSELAAIEPELKEAGAEARTRHALELGRTYASATHRPGSVSADDRERARAAFLRARDIASTARLDALAVDALHMMVFVDADLDQQVGWNRQALELSLASEQPAARRWEASLRNNLGLALRELGRYDEALEQFRAQEALRKRAGQAAGARIARWQVARTLRAMGRNGEALSMQLALAQETEAAGAPDPYVFEELEALYRALGEEERATHFAQRRRALQDRSAGR